LDQKQPGSIRVLLNHRSTSHDCLSSQIERDQDAHNDLRHRRSSIPGQFESDPNPKRGVPPVEHWVKNIPRVGSNDGAASALDPLTAAGQQ